MPILKSITKEIDGEIKRLISEISGDDFDDYVAHSRGGLKKVCALEYVV